MVIGLLQFNYILCMRSKALRRSKRGSSSRSLWARVLRIPPECCRLWPKATERRLCPRPTSHWCMRGRAENVSSVLSPRCTYLSTKFFAAKIDGLTFKWYFLILTILLCCVRSLLRTWFVRLYVDSVKEPCYFFCFGSRATLAVSWNKPWTCVSDCSVHLHGK